jgi:hypothetical protein
MAKYEDPLFAEYRRTSRVGDIEFWLNVQGPKMTPQTKVDFEQLLEVARVDLAKKRMPTSATLKQYVILTQRHWIERPMAERRQTHMPEFRLYSDTFEGLKNDLQAAVEKGLKSKAARAEVHGWTLVITKHEPETQGSWARWAVTATPPDGEPLELDDRLDKNETVISAQRFMLQRLEDQFREIAMARSAAACAPTFEPEPVVSEPCPSVSSDQEDRLTTPISTPTPIAAPAKAGRLLTWRYAWTDKGQRVEGELEAANEKAARQAIRDQFNLKWVPNGATVARAS